MTGKPTFCVILAFVLLAGCAQSNSAADLAPAASPQPAAVTQPASPPAAAPAAPPAQKVAATPEEVKAQCWMKYENDKKIKNIDARLKLVEKCIDDTSRGLPPPRPER